MRFSEFWFASYLVEMFSSREKKFTFSAKMRRRSNINLKLIAQMLVKAGFDHIITVDMHSKESQGFFDTAIDNLRASPFLIQYIQDSVRNFYLTYFWKVTKYQGFSIWIMNWPCSYNVDTILWSYYVMNLRYSNEIA